MEDYSESMYIMFKNLKRYLLLVYRRWESSVRVFWVRFSTFCILWVLTILGYSEHLSVSIISFAVALGIYFLLSLQKAPLLLYGLLSGLIFIHSYYLMNHSLITILLFLYITMDSAFRLKARDFKIYFIANLLLSLLMIAINRDQVIEMMIMSLFFYFIVFSINRMINERREQKAII